MNITQQLKVVLIVSILSFQSLAATGVGEVTFSRGILTGQVDGDSPKILGKGTPLYNGQTLNTGSRGFAVIKLDDGTKMTLRPNTTLKINNVETKKDEENIFLSLFRGGFRALTGLISKSNPKAFKIQTTVATIGIRGTEFDARLCESDECDQENKKTGKKAKSETRVIGRIALLNGKANATEDGLASRPLSVGAAVYEQDLIETGIKSYMVIAFNDKSRVTMLPNTEFKIEAHQYKPEAPEESNSFFSFLKGGLRLVTGAIGKLNRKAVSIRTPVATIGIRGTGFDLICQGACVSPNTGVSSTSDGDGMYANVWSGAIEFQLSTGTKVLESGKTAYLNSSLAQPILVPALPTAIKGMGGAPRPDQVDIPKDLFGGIDDPEIKPGLYVNVRQGDVEVQGSDGSTVNLGAGEASVTSTTGAAVRLNYVPPFQAFDSVPEPDRVDAKMETMVKLFGEESSEEDNDFECVVQ
jgi:hypothetical protein